MVQTLKHDMRPDSSREEIARMRFVEKFRSFILNNLAADLRTAYDNRAKKAFAKRHGHEPSTSSEVYKSLVNDPTFKTYSLCRVNAQRMVWDAVLPGVTRDTEKLDKAALNIKAPGGLTLNPEFEVPRNVNALDVHMMPGSYTGLDGQTSMAPGAIYDRGLAIFSSGLMGENLDDIGRSIARYIVEKFPNFSPNAILDLGCTIGHNTLPWKISYPNADVHAIDASGPCLHYASTRSKMQGIEANFYQMNAEQLDFPDNSFDLVFSSMFLHELPVKVTRKVMKEAYRLLRPGGLMLHMELPPNNQTDPFEGFYLDWDSYYNNEPFYKTFRDQDPVDLISSGGFDESKYFQVVVPSIGFYGEDAVREAAQTVSTDIHDENTGRLADGVKWFAFGGWK